jgi:hypothetical protein
LEQFLPQLLNTLLGGGGQAVVAVLVISIIGLVADRKRMIADLKDKESRIDRMIDDYYKANIQVSEALSSIKQLLELRLKS